MTEVNANRNKRKLEPTWGFPIIVRVSDVDAEATDKSEQIFVVHPSILAKGSNYFKTLAESAPPALKSRRVEEQKGDVKKSAGEATEAEDEPFDAQSVLQSVSDIHLKEPGGAEVFALMLDFTYSGRLQKPLVPRTCALLFAMSFKFSINELQEICKFWWLDEATKSPSCSLSPRLAGESNTLRCINLNLVGLLREVYKRPDVQRVFHAAPVVDTGLSNALGATSPRFGFAEACWGNLAIQTYNQLTNPRSRSGLPGPSLLFHGDVIPPSASWHAITTALDGRQYKILPESCKLTRDEEHSIDAGAYGFTRLFLSLLGSAPIDGLLLFIGAMYRYERVRQGTASTSNAAAAAAQPQAQPQPQNHRAHRLHRQRARRAGGPAVIARARDQVPPPVPVQANNNVPLPHPANANANAGQQPPANGPAPVVAGGAGGAGGRGAEVLEIDGQQLRLTNDYRDMTPAALAFIRAHERTGGHASRQPIQSRDHISITQTFAATSIVHLLKPLEGIVLANDASYPSIRALLPYLGSHIKLSLALELLTSLCRVYGMPWSPGMSTPMPLWRLMRKPTMSRPGPLEGTVDLLHLARIASPVDTRDKPPVSQLTESTPPKSESKSPARETEAEANAKKTETNAEEAAEKKMEDKSCAKQLEGWAALEPFPNPGSWYYANGHREEGEKGMAGSMMPSTTWEQRRSDRREFSRADWDAFYQQTQNESGALQVDRIERLDSLFQEKGQLRHEETGESKNKSDDKCREIKSNVMDEYGPSCIVLVAKFATEIVFREVHGSALDELKRYLEQSRPPCSRALDIVLLLGAISLTRFTDANLSKHVGFRFTDANLSQPLPVPATLPPARPALIPIPSPPLAPAEEGTGAPIAPALGPASASASKTESKSALYGLLIAADPAADREPFSTSASLRYQRLCLLLLEDALDKFRKSTNLETDNQMWTTLRLIEFHRFVCHDESWDLLLQLTSVAEARMPKDEESDRRSKAIAHLARHRILKEHKRLSLDKLRTARTCPWIPDSFIQMILLSDEREKAAAERLRAREADEKRIFEIAQQRGAPAYAIGMVLDVSDIEHWNNRWCPAEILDLKTDADGNVLIFVKYIGWEPLYNLWINTRRDMARLAPLGTHTERRQLVRLVPLEQGAEPVPEPHVHRRHRRAPRGPPAVPASDSDSDDFNDSDEDE